VFCSRTCRIDTIKKNGAEWMKELGRQNIKDLVKLIEWNEANVRLLTLPRSVA
jgi:UV DNA damage endonuclease